MMYILLPAKVLPLLKERLIEKRDRVGDALLVLRYDLELENSRLKFTCTI